LAQNNLYQNWKWGGIFNGLIFKQGLYDTSPLHEFIEDYFANRTIYRLVHFNSVDANTGEIVVFDETCDKETIVKGLCASTAVPFLFPPVKLGDRVLMDGGVAWNLDIASAIKKCRLLVDSDDKITLDVIDVDRSFADMELWNSTGNAISNFLRHNRIKDYFERIDDLREI
jgi:predicted patatin/cPLA2 family phospholipase